jgi:hypothetical protein
MAQAFLRTAKVTVVRYDIKFILLYEHVMTPLQANGHLWSFHVSSRRHSHAVRTSHTVFVIVYHIQHRHRYKFWNTQADVFSE